MPPARLGVAGAHNVPNTHAGQSTSLCFVEIKMEAGCA